MTSNRDRTCLESQAAGPRLPRHDAHLHVDALGIFRTGNLAALLLVCEAGSASGNPDFWALALDRPSFVIQLP
jgi:hypothetical protein